ncbi:uncharacterized protein C19orf44 homolog isoform X2 [Antennarius striatus]|uniref:uncharacterized protein C19orf44 homolog isoform X2 n=1 Tax=Antennarius striatus TaxID=241820 RepID=UPI0035B3B4DF
MWKRGCESIALDRAEALLSAKRSSREPESCRESGATSQDDGGGSVKVKFAFPNSNVIFSDVSDLSSSSSSEPRAAGETQRGERDSFKDLRPQSSLGTGGSRFLKKAPASATNSHQSAVSNKNPMQQGLKPRGVSSFRGSQTAALSRLSQIESRFCSRLQARQVPQPAEDLTSSMRISLPAAAQSPEASVEASEESSSHQSFRGKRFLKKNTSAAVINTKTASVQPQQAPNVGVRSRSRAADAMIPVGVDAKRVTSGVSLESDEEDMRKLLGDSWDSVDNCLLMPSSKRISDKMFSKGNQKVYSPPPPPAAPSSFSNTSPSHSPTPPRHGSPFRFIGEAQSHFSPSVHSPSPSSRHVSLSSLWRQKSPQQLESGQRSLSSMSSRSEVVSLEELFPVEPGSESPHSQTSAVSSEEFDIKVMTLDDLVRANPAGSEEAPGKEATLNPASLNRQQLLRMNEEEQEEGVLDYQSDFESESRWEPDNSASLVSENFQVHEAEDEVASEVREAASGMSSVRTEEDLSSSSSRTSHSYMSPTSDHSQSASRSRNIGSRCFESSNMSRSHSSHTFSCQARRYTSAAMATPGGSYVDPYPEVTDTLGAEMVEALSTFNPATFSVHELLKQQFAIIKQFIESSRRLHSNLVQSLEPPNYRYTKLEDTKESIHKYRLSRLMRKEVLHERRDSHHV